MKNLILFFILGLFIVSCQKEEDLNGDGLLGNWVYVSQDVTNNGNGFDETTLLKRTKKLDINNFSVGFYDNEFMIDNSNSGFCGTPPITYAKYEGKWEMFDNIVEYKCDFWGGQKIIKFEIISVDKEYLRIKVLESDYIYTR